MLPIPGVLSTTGMYDTIACSIVLTMLAVEKYSFTGPGGLPSVRVIVGECEADLHLHLESSVWLYHVLE